MSSHWIVETLVSSTLLMLIVLAVLAGAEAGTRAACGSTVLKSAFSRTPTAACAMNHKSQLKQRIAMMKFSNSGAAHTAIGAVFAAALIGGGLLLSASGTAAAPPVAPIDAVPAVPAVPPAPSAAAPPSRPHASHRVVVRDGVVIRDDKLSAADERAVREVGRAAERDARAAGSRYRRMPTLGNLRFATAGLRPASRLRFANR